MRVFRSDDSGWLALCAFVAVYDAVALAQGTETLSEAFRRYPRRVTFPLIFVTVIHLLLPKRPVRVLNEYRQSTRST